MLDPFRFDFPRFPLLSGKTVARLKITVKTNDEMRWDDDALDAAARWLKAFPTSLPPARSKIFDIFQNILKGEWQVKGGRQLTVYLRIFDYFPLEMRCCSWRGWQLRAVEVLHPSQHHYAIPMAKIVEQRLSFNFLAMAFNFDGNFMLFSINISNYSFISYEWNVVIYPLENVSSCFPCNWRVNTRLHWFSIKAKCFQQTFSHFYIFIFSHFPVSSQNRKSIFLQVFFHKVVFFLQIETILLTVLVSLLLYIPLLSSPSLLLLPLFWINNFESVVTRCFGCFFDTFSTRNSIKSRVFCSTKLENHWKNRSNWRKF